MRASVAALCRAYLLTAGFVVLLVVNFAHSADYYINAVSGNDAWSGTQPDSAWRSFAKPNQNIFKPGDNLRLKGGCSWSQRLAPRGSGTSAQRILISTYGSGVPVIDAGGAEEALLIHNQSYIVIDGLEITNRSPSQKANRIARGIHCLVDSAGNYPGVIIRNNFIHDIEGWVRNQRWRTGAIFVRATHEQGHFDNLLIENNQVRNCSVRGIQIGDGATTDSLWHRNLIIRGNTIDNVGMEGIMVSDAQDVLIEHNTVYRSGNYLLDDNLDSVCIAGLWCRGKNTTIQFNEVAHTRLSNPYPRATMDSEAFDVDLNTPGFTIIQYNYSHDNEGGFFLFMGNPGVAFTSATIRYNISVNDGLKFNNRTFEMHSHAGGGRFPVSIYNNTFYSDSSIGVLDRDGGTGVHRGWEFRNNIFYAPRGRYDDTARIIYENNVYWNHSPSSGDIKALRTDPLLINPGIVGDGFSLLSRFSLRVNSPIRQAGVIIASNGAGDFFGNSLPAGMPDIGASQFVAGSKAIANRSSSARVGRAAASRTITVNQFPLRNRSLPQMQANGRTIVPGRSLAPGMSITVHKNIWGRN